MTRKDKYARIIRNLVFIVPIGMLVILVGGCSRGLDSKSQNDSSIAPSTLESSYRPVNGMVQTHDGGGVTIDVEWKGIENDSLVLNISMNTHSVELDQYDLSKLTVLLDSNGLEYTATSWDSAPGGHHRMGVIRFPVPPSLTQKTTTYIKLVIRNIAGVDERVLRWDVK